MVLSEKKLLLLIAILVLLGAFLRFYNLNWGAPFYFHPDERNMAFAISQLSYPDQLNPHFFAYGSLPLYSIYFVGVLSNMFSSCFIALTQCLTKESFEAISRVTFEQAIIISRSFTAVYSVLLIPLLAILGIKLYGKTAGILVAALATFSVGFIQFAHFGTTEMWLVFFSVLLCLLLLALQKKVTVSLLLGIGLVSGLLIATKISAIPLLILPLYSLCVPYYKQGRLFRVSTVGKLLMQYGGLLFIACFIYIITNPFTLLDMQAFLDSMRYETTLAQGTLPVFYTQEFFNTIPILFQFLYIYPFLLNPILTLFILPSTLLLILRVLRDKDDKSLLILAFLSLLFFSQAFLFAKWTRYMVPTLPFLYLLFVGAADTLVKEHFFFFNSRSFRYVVSIILISICSLFAFSYVQTVFASPDTRISAASFAKQHIPQHAKILSEVYDLGITPFNTDYPQITLFNFYDLDEHNPEASPEMLHKILTENEYIILPSQRLIKTRLSQPDKFPLGYQFYNELEQGKTYRKIYETPCTFFCTLTYLGNAIFSYEQTASVFDRPTVIIYEKK